jgi:hypothetical protein
MQTPETVCDFALLAPIIHYHYGWLRAFSKFEVMLNSRIIADTERFQIMAQRLIA